MALAFIFALSISTSGSAQAQHFFGRGIQDADQKSILTLTCLDASGACTQVAWQIELKNQSAIQLGKPYSISVQTMTEYEAFLQLDGLESGSEFFDLEKDEFAHTAFQKYINGFAQHARTNFKNKKGWFNRIDRTYFNGTDISASSFADRSAELSKLQEVSAKKGWNWSSAPKEVSHSYFKNMLTLVLLRALESEQIKAISSERTLENYIQTILEDRKAEQLLRNAGFQPNGQMVHFKNGELILQIAKRVGLSK